MLRSNRPTQQGRGFPGRDDSPLVPIRYSSSLQYCEQGLSHIAVRKSLENKGGFVRSHDLRFQSRQRTNLLNEYWEQLAGERKDEPNQQLMTILKANRQICIAVGRNIYPNFPAARQHLVLFSKSCQPVERGPGVGLTCLDSIGWWWKKWLDAGEYLSKESPSFLDWTGHQSHSAPLHFFRLLGISE
jgi:hypothetical protein